MSVYVNVILYVASSVMSARVSSEGDRNRKQLHINCPEFDVLLVGLFSVPLHAPICTLYSCMGVCEYEQNVLSNASLSFLTYHLHHPYHSRSELVHTTSHAVQSKGQVHDGVWSSEAVLRQEVLLPLQFLYRRMLETLVVSHMKWRQISGRQDAWMGSFVQFVWTHQMWRTNARCSSNPAS